VERHHGRSECLQCRRVAGGEIAEPGRQVPRIDPRLEIRAQRRSRGAEHLLEGRREVAVADRGEEIRQPVRQAAQVEIRAHGRPQRGARTRLPRGEVGRNGRHEQPLARRRQLQHHPWR
jgi:hypothetical protein